jgi:hypothetical protein
MKIRSLVVALFLTVSGQAFAQWFPAPASVTVLPGQVAAQIVNPYLNPIICSGQVYGQTFRGQIFNTYFYEQFIPAHGYRIAYVGTTAFFPFVTGWANVQCRMAGIW